MKKVSEAQKRASKNWKEKNKELSNYISQRSSARSFIKNKMTESDAEELQQLIMERLRVLKMGDVADDIKEKATEKRIKFIGQTEDKMVTYTEEASSYEELYYRLLKRGLIRVDASHGKLSEVDYKQLIQSDKERCYYQYFEEIK